LIESEGNYILYFGDTGADEIEGYKKLEHIFQEITPLIQKNKLHAILTEVSFPNEQDSKYLYGHLKPELLEKELNKLAQLIQPNDKNHALSGVKILITHIKPDYKLKNNSRKTIIKELEEMNKFGAEFIYPHQSEKFEF